jgi:hypothetical protein
VIGAGQIMFKQREESASFLKKRSKKLFLIWAVLVSPPPAHRGQKFFAPLFFKKAATFLFPLKPIRL